MPRSLAWAVRILGVLALIVCPLLAAFWHYSPGLLAVSGIPHAAANLFMLVLFGRSLLPGRDTAVTVIARKWHGAQNGELPADLLAYTRRVTLAWCIFFVAQLVMSLALLMFAPISVWWFFVDVLSWPSLALMFAIEYAYRIVRYRHHPHPTLRNGLRALMRRDAPLAQRADGP